MAATPTIIDVRRTDLRTNVLENPYWITSGEIDKSHDDKASLLFSFPITCTYFTRISMPIILFLSVL